MMSQFLPSLQLTLYEAAQTRLRHTTSAISLEPGRTRVIMFGGCPKWEWKKSGYNQPELALTAVLEFGKKTRLHNCGVLVSLLISFIVSSSTLHVNIDFVLLEQRTSIGWHAKNSIHKQGRNGEPKLWICMRYRRNFFSHFLSTHLSLFPSLNIIHFLHSLIAALIFFFSNHE